MRSSSMRFSPHSAEARRGLGKRGARSPQSSLPRLLGSVVLGLSRGWLPNQYLGHLRPLTSTGQPSCDGSMAEFRIIDLITQHDVSADEKFSGSRYFGLRSTATLCQSLVETL